MRDALSRAAAKAAVTLARAGEGSLSQVLDERALINAVVMLLATGGARPT
ncbi:hypothetical protein ULF88_17875 [Halopseudomonas pachastrellae]|nr:hypothetical protein [Halopseudomonas pachastrellae]